MNQETEETNKFKVAVYGTLRTGQGNWAWALRDTAKYLGKQNISGFDLLAGSGFPFAVEREDEEGKVLIEIFEVNENTFRRLDGLEGYPHFYDRKEIDTEFGKAWIYFCNEERGRRPVIEDGDWVSYIGDRRKFQLT